MRIASRRIAVLLLLLIGGAIVNVAVAWGCVVCSITWQDDTVQQFVHHFDGGGSARIVSEPGYTIISRWIPMSISSPVLAERVTAAEFARMVPRGSAFWDRNPIVGESLCGYQEAVAGMPAFALRGSVSFPKDGWDVEMRGVLILRVERLQTARHQFPLIPMFPGFIINTVFYAALLWLLFIAPFTVRRLLRRKRRLCERCAYPIGVSPVCTECGAPVRAKESAPPELK